MLLAIQFPLADSRKFLDSANRVTKPLWPIPEPDSEFVRCFGSIRERKAGGITGWGSENENVICEADRALSFRTNLSLIDPSENFHLILRRAFSRFYFDGRAVGKLEVGVTTKTRSEVIVTQKQTRKTINHFLNLPVQIPNPLEPPSNRRLVEAGKDLARLYLIATTYNKFRSSISSKGWQVQSGAPLLFMEFANNEIVEIPNGARSIPLAEQFGLHLFRYAVPYEGGRTNMWILEHGATTDPGKVRTLRLCLLRLHAEHECLRLILRNVILGNIVVTRGTDTSNSLQEYFDRAITNINRLEAKSEQRFSAEVVDIARNAIDMVDSGLRDTLLASIESLDLRGNVTRKVMDYSIINIGNIYGPVGAIGNQNQVTQTERVPDANQVAKGQPSLDPKEGVMASDPGNSGGGIHFGDIHGPVGAIGNQNQVTQNIGNIPTDQATREQLNQLVAQLRAELQKAAPENTTDAAAVGDLTDQLVAAVAKEQPNKTLVQITAEGLKKAAENISSVLPTVLPIATQIATTIMKVAGIPIPV